MAYCVILRTLKGESNPGKAMITNYESFKKLLSYENAKDWIEYWVKPFENYQEALDKCKELNDYWDYFIDSSLLTCEL